ncbi:hypothetical protein X777_15743 [Ooceraea biroi]|uniref:Uncharacterized protein n=1 Tax=Ooceraea biroi TaxID=2015173 RepID=A0A026WSY2_OOCBI|nr:hypothetical protein X777_15743 [Ooceraea biroi]
MCKMLLGARGDVEYRISQSSARLRSKDGFRGDAVLQQNILRQDHDSFSCVIWYGTDQGDQTMCLAQVANGMISLDVSDTLCL